MRRFLPFFALIITTSVFAQQSQPYSQSPSTGDKQNNYGVPPAPKPGHPLDPNDVATLTGKNDQQRPAYATPQVYYSAPVGGSIFTQSTVGNAFQSQPYGYMGYRRNWAGNSGWGWGPYYGSGVDLNGSQFANVTTETRAPLFRTGPGFAPIPLFGGNFSGRPGRFGANRWRPNLWFGPGAHFQNPTGLGFLPSPRP